MAGSRLSQVGSIFSRAEGLYRGGVLKSDELPLWFNIWKAFPPKVDPDVMRSPPEVEVKKLIYAEDVIRSHFQKTYGLQEHATADLTKIDSVADLTINRYVKYYKDIASRDDGKTAGEIEEAVQHRMLLHGVKLKRRPS